MPSALITGVSGQDGTYLSRTLLKRGYDVHGLVKPGDGAKTTAGVIVHRCDLRDAAELRRLTLELQPNEIYNLGGQSSVAASWDDPLGTLAASGTPVGALLDAAWELQESHRVAPRVVQASSAEIFGNAAQSPQNETTPIAPVSPYGVAKALGHFLVGSYRQRGLHASSVILYNHESPLRPPTFVTRKITRAAARIAQGLDSTLRLGTLDVQRDWGWAPDYVEAMRLAAGHETGGDYVIGTGVSHSVRDFVETAFRAAGISDWEAHVEIDQTYLRPADPAVQLADSSRAREVLGWAPTVGFDELVQRMVAADLSA
ncbi:MAG: GDP-mannose 4,6-dehydratase [Homoserinimonas sp.]